jgi:hypothetical protein
MNYETRDMSYRSKGKESRIENSEAGASIDSVIFLNK